MKRSKLKIGSDIDQCIADWWDPYFKRFGAPKNDAQITWICNNILAKDREFWLNLPVMRRFEGFDPVLYCTKRSCLKIYTKDWLDNNEFPHKPVYQVYCQIDNKARYIKGRCDVFLDDSPTNFIQMNRSGVPCLLVDSPNNQYLGPMLRIHSLNYDEIEDVYNLAKEMNIFKEFKMYYDC